MAIEAPNFDFDAEWDISALPWHLLPFGSDNAQREADKELDPPLLQAIETLVSSDDASKATIGTSVAFLYLFMIMAGHERNA